MDKQHKKISEELYQTASFILTESGKDTPLFVLIKNNETFPILIPPGMEIDLATYSTLSLKLAREYDADAMIVIGGMWVVTDLVDNIDFQTRPSESDKREHYLNLIYITADGKTLESLAGKVEKDPAGTMYVREQDWLDSVQDFSLLQSWK
jgi:hypothetical protein